MKKRHLLFVVLGILVLAWPLVLHGVFIQHVAALLVLAAISASAWNIVGGYGGQVSIGHAMFFGAGAYGALAAYTDFGWPPVAGVPLGIIAALLIAVLVGLPTFRLQGHYFSMATIAAVELLRILLSNVSVLGASVGLMGPARPRGLADLSFRSPVPYYYLFLAVLALLLVVTAWMERSRLGFYLRAIRGGERGARSLGVPVVRTKLIALMISAGFTALAGGLYALMVGFIDPESGFGLLISVKMVIIAALGGAGTLWGPLVGAAILIPLEESTNALFGGSGTGATYVVYGAIIVLISRFLPGGIAELVQLLSVKARRRAA